MDLSIIKDLKDKANKRYDDFEIKEDVDNLIENINDEAYILKPKWIGGDTEYVALFIDLNNSTELSNNRLKQVMAKIYDYFTQSIIDCLYVDGYANYIDIKGDGVFAIFEGDNAEERAFIAGVTFKTFFSKHIIPKFKNTNDINLTCKIGMYKDKILVRKLGNKIFQNEVWAGRLINVISKLTSYPKTDQIGKKEETYFVIPNDIYDYFFKNYKNFIINSCGCSEGKEGDIKENIWSEFSVSNDDKAELGNSIDKIYIMNSDWCDNHGQEYIDEILGNN